MQSLSQSGCPGAGATETPVSRFESLNGGRQIGQRWVFPIQSRLRPLLSRPIRRIQFQIRHDRSPMSLRACRRSRSSGNNRSVAFCAAGDVIP